MIHTFLSDELKAEESKDYLNRIETHPEKYSIEGFHQNVKKFGTLSVLSNTTNSAEKIYGFSLEAWMFINYITLHWYYVLLNKLKSSELNNKFSPSDLNKFLKEVKKVKLNGKWYEAEVTAKTTEIINKLNIPIT